MLINRIDRYIFKTVFSSFFIVTIIFCILFFIFTYLAQVNNNRNINNLNIIINTLFQLPVILYKLLPVCAMVGSLMGLNLLSNNSEIIILRSSGYSIAQISKGVVLVGIIGSITTLIFGGYIAPILQSKTGNRIIKYNTHNLWFKTSDGFMNITNIEPDNGKAYGIRKYILLNDKIKEIQYAESANYIDNESANLIKSSKISFPSNNGVTHINIIKNFPNTIWLNPIPISIAKVITIKNTDYLNFSQLLSYILSKNQSKNYISLKFWQEIFQPLTLMVLILISVPLSIGSTRSSALIFKLLLGSFFGFIFFIMNQIFGPITLILHLPIVIGAAGPTILALILLVYLFIKSKET